MSYFYINDGKFEPRAKKVIFLGYAIEVKGYILWCPYPKSPKIVISRDVTFDGYFMLQPKKESVVDITGSGEEASKHVELVSKDSEGVQERIHFEPVDNAQDSTSIDDTPPEQQYNIVIWRARRPI